MADYLVIQKHHGLGSEKSPIHVSNVDSVAFDGGFVAMKRFNRSREAGAVHGLELVAAFPENEVGHIKLKE